MGYTQSFSVSLSDDNTHTWNGYTLRQFIPQASLLVTGGSKIRLTANANAATNGSTYQKMYVGQAGGSYSATSPQAAALTQVLFSASASLTIAAGGAAVVSDDVAIPMPSSQGLLVAWYQVTSNFYFPANTSSPASGILSYKNADDVTTLNATGYTDYSATAKAGAISKIEVFNPDFGWLTALDPNRAVYDGWREERVVGLG